MLRQIGEGPILKGLWLPPLVELAEQADAVAEARMLLPSGVTGSPWTGPKHRHNITHRRIDVVPVRFKVNHFDPPSDEWCWVDPERPGVPTSSLLGKFVKALAG